jgi:NADH:ubiquinone oxidoreductase subunit 5 (subunit L)/multisubunit Na+/H+ antiporter MnhA subunit
MGSYLLVVCVAVPFLGAFLLPLIGKISSRLRNLAALVFVAAGFILAALALPDVLSGRPLSLHFDLPLGLSFGFYGDALAVFMAMTSSFVAAIIVLYSFGYIHKYPNQNEYYLMVCLFIGSMLGLVFSTNLIFIYAFWEITAICCWRLIDFYREKLTIRRANKALIMTVAGAFIMLLGFFGIYSQTGTFDLTAMKGISIPSWAIILILFGILSKSATFPLHSWLPDAGVAPSPVTSLLHAAVLVKIGVYVYARLFVVNFSIDPAFTVAVPVIAAVSALVSAGAALWEHDMKRILAYSTISQLAFILLGLSCGTEIGVVGGMLYILMHSVAKGGLFLCAGIVEHQLHTKDIRKMGGLYQRMPVTAAAFIFCAFSIMGLPPFGGFFAKHLVLDGIVSSGNVALAAVFIVGAILTVIYLARLFMYMFLGEPARTGMEPHGTAAAVREGTPVMVISVAILATLSLLLGILISLPAGLAALIGRGV